jgi:hypothetical protein
LILIHPMHGLGLSRRGSKCVIWYDRLVFVLWAQENSDHKSHSWKILEATNWQKNQTIASQPSQLILIHPMHGLGLSRRVSKCVIWCSRMFFVLWAGGIIQITNPLLGKFWWLLTDKRPKQLLLNHHNWSWYIQCMVWDCLEGDPSASFDAEGWFLYCGPGE